METLPDVYIYLLNLQFDLKRTASLPLKHGARGSCPFGLKWPIFQGKTWLVLGELSFWVKMAYFSRENLVSFREGKADRH